MLLIPIIIPIVLCKNIEKYVLGYYSIILLVVGILQNAAFTDNFGFVWIIGNTLVQFIVFGFCIYDLKSGKTKILKHNLNKKRLWLIFPMLLAFLMPYSVNSSNIVYPDINYNVLTNEVGVTYCMITPVIIGILLLFSTDVNKATLSIISYVGFYFGLMNAITWFIIKTESWWMGILHLPLLIISLYGLIDSYHRRS